MSAISEYKRRMFYRYFKILSFGEHVVNAEIQVTITNGQLQGIFVWFRYLNSELHETSESINERCVVDHLFRVHTRDDKTNVVTIDGTIYELTVIVTKREDGRHVSKINVLHPDNMYPFPVYSETNEHFETVEDWNTNDLTLIEIAHESV